MLTKESIEIIFSHTLTLVNSNKYYVSSRRGVQYIECDIDYKSERDFWISADGLNLTQTKLMQLLPSNALKFNEKKGKGISKVSISLKKFADKLLYQKITLVPSDRLNEYILVLTESKGYESIYVARLRSADLKYIQMYEEGKKAKNLSDISLYWNTLVKLSGQDIVTRICNHLGIFSLSDNFNTLSTVMYVPDSYKTWSTLESMILFQIYEYFNSHNMSLDGIRRDPLFGKILSENYFPSNQTELTNLKFGRYD